MYTTLRQSDGRLPQQMFPHLTLLGPLPSLRVGEMSTSMNLSARLRTPKCSSQCSSFFFHFYDISKVCFTFKLNSTFSGSTLKDVYLYTDPRHRCVNIKHDYWFTGGLAGALTRISNAIYFSKRLNVCHPFERDESVQPGPAACLG